MPQKRPKNLPDTMSLSKHRKKGKAVNVKHFTGKKCKKKKKRESSTTRKQRKAKKGSHKNRYER